MNYGFSYMGSKSKIAPEIIRLLPSADNLYDLFAGGGAITHCAILSRKWKNIYANDIQNTMQLFEDAINGKYHNEKRWISREQFFAEKDSDPYIRWIWSFGNNGRGYLFGKNIEEMKKAFHYVVVFDDWTYYDKLYNSQEMSETLAKYKIHDRKAFLDLYRDKFRAGGGRKEHLRVVKWIQNNWYSVNNIYCRGVSTVTGLEHLQRLEHLERLHSLEGINGFSVSALDYRDVAIEPNSVVYCDIPYKQKKHVSKEDYYELDFDTEAFYEWAKAQESPVFFSSCFCEDKDFAEIWTKEKHCLMGSNGTAGKVLERIYCNKPAKRRIEAEGMEMKLEI